MGERSTWDRRCHLCGEMVWVLWTQEVRHDCVEDATAVNQCKYAMAKARQRAEIVKAGGLNAWSLQNPDAELIL